MAFAELTLESFARWSYEGLCVPGGEMIGERAMPYLIPALIFVLEAIAALLIFCVVAGWTLRAIGYCRYGAAYVRYWTAEYRRRLP
ncbi:hypothetical protein [Bradyrhizobium sp. dw_78]|uniref:hypothetical protein n=1 Tax=Bradyrhizobium sp. dw_78 TaxID=2719793 RepID=UPI001BD5CC83|nr:hypothetical protein [Bradyrhizobium sp. dw_78]